LSVFPYIFQAKYVRNKKINENKLVGGTTTWGTIWGSVYEHLCMLMERKTRFFEVKGNAENGGSTNLQGIPFLI
jgi:hypothetical protein